MNNVPHQDYMTYDKPRKVLTMRSPIGHVVKISKDGHRLDWFGYDIMELHLDCPGEKAILKTPRGAVELQIEPSKKEYNRVLIGHNSKTSKVFKIGEVARGYGYDDDGKDALLYLLEESEGGDLSLNFLISKLFQFATAKGLVDDYDWEAERDALKTREDFEYGKDYSFLYKVGDNLPLEARSEQA